jgi:HEAT repeat protein
MPVGASRTHLKAFRQDCQELEVPLICSTRELYGGDLGIQRKLEIQPLNPREIERFLQECLPEYQDQVRQLLQRDNRDLSRTPFVLWMLYHLLNETGTIASSLGEAFRQFFRYHFRNYKEDVPVSEERRKSWNLWMEHLAFSMLSSPDPLDPGLVISEEDAESKLIDRFGELQGQPSRIEELKKYHLLTSVSDREIGFKHQLIQEYYAAEELLLRLDKKHHNFIEDEYLQHFYLNQLKWTESLSFVVSFWKGQENRDNVARLVNLALEVDWVLGARLVGETHPDYQKFLLDLFDRFIERKQIQDWLKGELWKSYRSREEISTLIKYLKYGKRYQKDFARKTLCKSGDKQAISTLIYILENEELDLQVEAVSILGRLKAKEAIPSLIIFLKNQEFNSGMIAAEAVAEIGLDKNSFLTIAHLLKHKNPDVRKNAVETLGNSKLEPAVECLILVLEEDDDFGVCSRAIFQLGKIRAKQAVPNMVKAIESGRFVGSWNSGIRKGIAYALGQIGGESAIRGLTQLLDDPDPWVQQAAAQAIGKVGAEKTVFHLQQAIKHRNWDILSSMIDSTENITDEDLISEFRILLEDVDPDFRDCAARALGKTSCHKVIPNLIRRIKEDEEPEVRREAIESLGKLDAEEFIPHLVQVIMNDNEDPSVLAEAAKALGKLGAQEAAPRIISLFERSDDWVQRCAADAIGYLKYKEGIPELIELLAKDDDGEVRGHVITALGRFEDDSAAHALPHLLKLLNEPGGMTAFRAIQIIQANCKFYDYKIHNQAQQIHEEILKMGSSPKNDFRGASFSGPVNFGDNPTGDFINTQNNYNTNPEIQKAISELKVLLAQLKTQHPTITTEAEALEIIDVELAEPKLSQSYKLANLKKQIFNPERHLQAGKETLVDTLKHFLGNSIWAKAAITYINKLSEEPNYGP